MSSGTRKIPKISAVYSTIQHRCSIESNRRSQLFQHRSDHLLKSRKAHEVVPHQTNRYAAQGLGLRISTLSLTQLYGSLPFVPFGDFSGRPFLRMVSDPARDFFIGCPGGYEAPERIVLKLSELQPPLIERAVGEVIALPPDKCRPAFVQRARSQCIPTELLSRAARELFVVPQIASQQFYFFKVFFHGFSLFLRSFSPPQFFSSHVVIQFVIARIATVDRIRTTVPLLCPQAAEAI